MNLYYYVGLDKYGKPKYQKIEISDEEAKNWIQVDYLTRLKKDPHAQRRTIQQISDEIDRSMLNSDRREQSHRTRFNTFSGDEGKEETIYEKLADTTPRFEDEIADKDYLETLFRNMDDIYADILIRVKYDGQDIKEYAAAKGITYENARKRLSRALVMAKKIAKKI